MPETSTARTRFYVGDSAIDDKDTDFAVADFSGVTWVEVGGLMSIGTAGDETNEIAFDLINRGRTKVLKGTKRAPTLDVVTALNHANAGQAKLLEAEASSNNYPFRLVYDDTPATGPAPTPSERLFIGMVMSAGEQLDDANNVIRFNTSIAPNSNLVRVNAATGA